MVTSVLSSEMERSMLVLRDYLDQIRFVRLYKLTVTSRFHDENPNVLSRWSLAQVAGLEVFVNGERATHGLAACLMLRTCVPRAALPRSSSSCVNLPEATTPQVHLGSDSLRLAFAGAAREHAFRQPNTRMSI